MRRKLDIVANIVILVVAALACFVLVENYLARRAVRATTPQVSIGSELSVPGVEWKANGNTLVMALSTNCHFCTESAPFYTRLARELSLPGVHLMVILPQNAEDSSNYLRGLNLDFSDVRQVSMRAVKIRGTPTLLIVDAHGVVRHVWEGKLSPREEREVIETIRAIRSQAGTAAASAFSCSAHIPRGRPDFTQQLTSRRYAGPGQKPLVQRKRRGVTPLCRWQTQAACS